MTEPVSRRPPTQSSSVPPLSAYFAVTSSSPTVMSTDHYTAPPPAYTGPKLSKVPADDEATQPLLSPTAGPSSGPGGIYDQPGFDDIPDDFKVCYTVRYAKRTS